MSHFNVLVISEHDLRDKENLEKILLPYHEYECTGIEEYLEDVDVTDETKELFERHRDSYNDIVEFAKEWNGASAVTAEDGSVKFIRRTNPNAKWDWWVVGGRWLGGLLPKDRSLSAKGQSGAFGNKADYDGGVDIVQKSNLDIEEMRNQAGKEQGELWDKMHAAVHDIDKTFTPWGELVAAIPSDAKERNESIEAARITYHAQPIVSVLSKSGLLSFFGGDQQIQDYLAGRDTMVEKGRNGALSAYAVVKDGKWHERGKMGWFGMSSNEISPEEWDKQFAKLIDETPGEHWLALVDCHI